MESKEFLIRIQTVERSDERFAADLAKALRSIAEYLDGAKKVPPTFKFNGDNGLLAQCDVQSTMSHINGIERKFQLDLDKVNAKLEEAFLGPAERQHYETLKTDLKACIKGIREGNDYDDHTIRMYDQPNGTVYPGGDY